MMLSKEPLIEFAFTVSFSLSLTLALSSLQRLSQLVTYCVV